MPPLGHPTLYGYRMQFRALAKNTLGSRMLRRFREMRWKDQLLANDNGTNEKHSKYRALFRHFPDYRGGMSLLSRRLASTMDPASILRRRNGNYRLLHDRLSAYRGYYSIFPAIEQGTCPLFLPIRILRREELHSSLSRQEIETFIFGNNAHPRMNKDRYPEANALRNEILCLPVHQYLNESQLVRLVEVTGPLLEKYAI